MIHFYSVASGLCGLSVLLFIPCSLHSQEHRLKLSSLSPTPLEYLKLLEPNSEIRDNIILNESIVDLADVYLTDSILPRKFERHQLALVGGFTRLVGRRWLTINWRKEKYVGTAKNGFRIPGEKEHFTEYDVNINLVPHLKRYIDLSFQGHARQKEIGRKKKKYHNYTKPPFIYPDEDTDLNAYHLHCELSPPRHYRSMINELVYPVIAGNTATKHHHFGDEQFTVGVYGAFVSDCNHHCHPEIHPYEWLWWLNVHPDTDIEPNSKTWVFGLFREGSNRMPHWSPKPRTGGISIPFVFPAEKKELLIELHHLVFSSFNEKGFSQLNIPAEALLFDKTEWKFSIADDTLQHVFIILKTNVPLFQKAIKFWFSSLNYDAQNGMLSGKLHLATSADELYTAKVKFSY